MRDKLLPWGALFGTPYPQEDFDGELKLLFVLAGEKEETVFQSVSDELHRQTGVFLPLATTYKDVLVKSAAVLSDPIWRHMDGRPAERSAAFSGGARTRRLKGRLHTLS